MSKDAGRFRTPLSRARGLGSAKSGVGEFMGQRASAMALCVLLLWGVWAALRLAPLGYEDAASWLRTPLHAAPLVLLFAVGFYHVQIGARVVIEDYVHAPGLKTAALLANLYLSLGAFVVAAMSVLKVAFSVSGAA
jgi:succinate dehydrogenase / fumarate reductase membrane anchor subunit